MSGFCGGYIPRVLDAAIVMLLLALLVASLRRSMLPRFLLSLALVLCCYLTADLFGLPLLRSLAAGTLAGIPILLAVIFQHDVRRWLSATAVASVQQPPRSDYLTELTAAVDQLSRQRMGALIVIQRHTPLDHLIEVGTEIDAKVTAELIASIFFPYSPIHDGAILIQNGKLTRAGCLLPLSQDPTLSRSLGTRHRAALGLSEQSDAVVVVVSEESGYISMAHGGSFTWKMDPGEVEEELRKSLSSSARARH